MPNHEAVEPGVRTAWAEKCTRGERYTDAGALAAVR